MTRSGVEVSVDSLLDERFSANQLAEAKTDPSRKERFLSDLKTTIQELLRPYARTLGSRLVSELNVVGYNLAAEEDEEDEDELCFRYSELSIDNQNSVMVAFDVHVSVLLVDTIPDDSSSNLLTTKSCECDMELFSRSVIEVMRSDPARIEAKEQELQAMLERLMCEELHGHLRAIAARLNALGHKLEELGGMAPEIDFRDPTTSLHMGIYCIATVGFPRIRAE